MYSILNNTPSAGFIQWSNVNIQYNGVSYAIANGHTNFTYVYWLATIPNNFVVSDTFPTLTNADVMVFLNKSGIAMVVPTATVFDGGLIVPGSIFATAIAANTITGNEIAADAISAIELAANSVIAGKIAANAVTAGTVAANAIGAAAIAAGAITADKIVAEAITGDKIAAATIAANRLIAGTITAASGVIANAAITNAVIADLAVTDAKIANATITGAKLVDATITTAKIGDAQVTNAKIASVVADKITAGNLVTATMSGRTVQVRINSTEGLAFYDSATYRGGLRVINNKVALVSDVMANAANLNHFIDYDVVDTNIFGMRFWSPFLSIARNTMAIYGHASDVNHVAHIGAIAEGTKRSTLTLFSSLGLFPSPTDCSVISLDGNQAANNLIQMYAVNGANSGLINIRPLTIEMILALETRFSLTSAVAMFRPTDSFQVRDTANTTRFSVRSSDGQLTIGNVPWARLTSVPTTFTPSAHNHSAPTITISDLVLMSGTLAGNTAIGNSTGTNYGFLPNFYSPAGVHMSVQCNITSSTTFACRVGLLNTSTSSWAYDIRLSRVAAA